MKYLKLFESFDGQTKNIHEICKKYGIENYTINSDGSIDVDGSVYLGSKNLEKLPLKFRAVTGYFDCNQNKLTSLEGAPTSVGTSFYCHDNYLTSLEGSPSSVGGGFYCNENQLTSLEGCPESIGGYFSCSYNRLTSLEGCPVSVGGSFYCGNNQLTSLEGGPISVSDDYDCANNYIEIFEGAPESVGGRFYCDGNSINIIWNLFIDFSKIELLNDYDIFREVDGKPAVIIDRLNDFLEEIGKSPGREKNKVKGVKGYINI
jgi:hypothetical protein